MSGRRVVSGSVSGAIASFSFAVVHAILISEIWFSLPMLMIAGGICGACLGWAYGIMIEKPAIGSWLSFNVIFVGFFFFIAILSELVYEPMVHNDTLNDGPPPASLYIRALPLMIFSVLGQTALVYWLFGRKWEHLPVILLTCSLLMLFLGLNVSLKGLVFVPATSYYLIVETFSLILSLNFVFVITFIVLEIKSLKPQLALYS